MSRSCRPSNLNQKDKIKMLKQHREYQLVKAIDMIFDKIHNEQPFNDSIQEYAKLRAKKLSDLRR